MQNSQRVVIVLASPRCLQLLPALYRVSSVKTIVVESWDTLVQELRDTNPSQPPLVVIAEPRGSNLEPKDFAKHLVQLTDAATVFVVPRNEVIDCIKLGITSVVAAEDPEDLLPVTAISLINRELILRQTRNTLASQFSESEHRFRNMSDHSPVMLWMASVDGRCNFFNQTWLKWTGRTLEQEKDYGWAEGVHPEDFQLCIDTFVASLSKRETFSMEYRLRRHDGVYRWVLDRGTPRYSDDGVFVGYVGSAIDIDDIRTLTEMKETLLVKEQKARNAVETMLVSVREASRLKDEFLATVSHELRTPLNAVIGWTELMAEGIVERTDRKEALQTILRNSRSLLSLIEDLLDMSRVISGKFRMDEQVLELADVINDAVQSVKLQALGKGIELTVTIDNSIGPMTGDPGRLRQVIWNLLTNALKFTPEGGRVSLDAVRTNGNVMISVSDTGIGIDADFLPYVFDRFRQAEQHATRRYGGLGLGLSISRYIVELHGGSVAADSQGTGCGATFTVKLPIRTVRIKPALSSSTEVTPTSTASKPLTGLQVLVVDDDPDTLFLTARILETAGAKVKSVTTGELALANLSAEFDYLVSDISMPGMSGLELIKQWRKKEKADSPIKAAALTAYAREIDREHCIEAGFDTYFSKPVSPKALISWILEAEPHRKQRG